jgi:putative ABC transport system permease protein
VVPALRSSRPRLVESLGHRGRETNSAIGPIAAILVVSQIATALVLLIGAGLMLRSYVRLVHVDPGFDASHVLAVSVTLPALRYPAPVQRIAAIDALLTRIRAVRGVQRAGATTQLPMGGGDNMIPITIEGQAAPPPNLAPAAALRVITPDYFRAMEIPLRQGRDFSSADARVALPLIRYFEQQPAPPRFADNQPAPVAIINEAMARQFWRGADPVGRAVRILFSPPLTIVGVVGDVRHAGLRAAVRPEIYLPHVQEPQGAMTLAIRTGGDPTAVAAAVRQEIRSVDRNLPVEGMQRMEDLVAGSAASTRFDTLLLGTCGAVAVALAMLGIYGVMAYSVARRAHEIGIRTALGAQRSDVLALVLRRAMLLTAVGIAIGLGMAAALTRLMQSLLFAVSATDATTFAAFTLALAGASLLASYLPARAALRMDPLEALRRM